MFTVVLKRLRKLNPSTTNSSFLLLLALCGNRLLPRNLLSFLWEAAEDDHCLFKLFAVVE